MSSEDAPRKVFLSWEEFHRDTRALAETLRARGPWDGIIAVARGGLVPAAIVANILGIRSIDTMCISSYSDATKAKDMDLEVLRSVGEKEGRWLVIDDLVDTGETAKMVRRLVPSASIACVYAKPAGQPHTDFFVTNFEQHTWIVFPWEE
jgi:xanthine phosphoribosyltransferase